MLNRQQRPATPPFPALSVPHIKRGVLGDVPLFLHVSQESPLVFVSFFFPAGDWHAKLPGVASLTARMLTRGTETKGLHEIAAEIDYCGAQINCIATRDHLKVVLISPPAHVRRLLPLLAEIISKPTFPEEALKTLKPILGEEIKQAEANANILGNMKLREYVFGAKHPYGHTLTVEELGQITAEDLRSHYARHGKDPCHVCMGGAVSEAMLADLENCFGSFKVFKKREEGISVEGSAGGSWHIPKKGCVQATIHMGHPTITLTNPDYPGLYVTNVLLGGFFGSRLMSNLREDKGYTYGVHTQIQGMRHAGYWFLNTSVRKEHAGVACEEIRKEIRKLQTVAVGDEELRLLKNYLLGSLLELFDGSLAINRRLDAVLLHGMDLTFFERLYATVQNIDAATIQAMAQKYLGVPSLCEVIVGGETASE